MNTNNTNTTVWREFETRRTAKSKPVKIKLGLDFSGVPTQSLLVLAARQVIIDLQRSWRTDAKDDEAFKRKLESLDGTTLSVREWLVKKPLKDNVTPKIKKFVKASKEIGLDDSTIIDLAVKKGYDKELVKKVIDELK